VKLRLIRIEALEDATMDLVLIDGKFECYALEDPIGVQSDDSKGPIPTGTFDVEITFSQRFQRPLMLMVGVPGREGIRWHSGATAADTKGCILPGRERTFNRMVESITARQLLQRQVQQALNHGERVTCSVEELL
jgi:hypothetical protein